MKFLYIFLGCLLPVLCFGQVFTGTVINTDKQPLVGITVTLKGTNTQTATNEQGEFKITLNGYSRTIRFTATDYETVEVKVTKQADFFVTLVKKNNKLDEVQIVAYGTNTQRYNLGSVTKVTADDIAKQAVANPLEALQGRVAGLTVSSSSGLPGASFNVQIRGQNTLRGSQLQLSPKDNPLFIIDGIPYAPQNTNINQLASIIAPGDGSLYNNPYGGLSPFNSINPSDIESIEVLRDADATAIYGSRGGNGVILITTKKGKAGKTAVSFNLRNGVSFVGKTMPMMNTDQYLAMRREAFKNDGITPNSTLYDPGYSPDLTVFDSTRYTDWKKMFIGNTAHNTNATGSVSGGNENTQFRIGFGYNRDTYIFPGDFADKRATFSAHIHHATPDKKFTIDFSSTYSYDKNNLSGSQNFLLSTTLEPNYPALTDNSGKLIWNYKGVTLDGGYAGGNPYAYLNRPYNIQNINLTSNLLLAYQLAKGLVLRSSLGYNTFGVKEFTATPASTLNPAYNPTSSATFANNNFSAWIIEPQLEYKTSYKRSSVSILIGSTLQKDNNNKTTVDGYGYTNENLLNSISGAPQVTASDGFNEYKYSAIFGRINYKFDNKYLLNINARRDGSSRFGPSKQFGNFGSVGAGWLFSEENFTKNNVKFLSYGKLRATYGITGSDAISDYQYISTWAPARFPYGGVPGYLPQNLYNPQLSWASTKKLEFGLELGFFNDKFLFNATWYRNRSGDQLITYNLPAQTGFQSVYENWAAVVQNSGWEFTVQSSIIKNRDFTWNAAFNFTLPKNKLLSFPDIQNSSYSTIYFVGKSVNTVTGYNYGGVDPATGLFQFISASGQKTSAPESASLGKLNDAVIFGNTDPKFFGGLQNSFGFKNIHLDVFTEFKKQMGLNYLAQVYAFLPGMETNVPVSILEGRWQSPGQNAAYQRFTSQYGEAYTTGSSFSHSNAVFSDASYVRIKTATISYDLSSNVLRKMKIRQLRIFVSAQNLFTITNYKGNDPETQNFYGIPPLKSYSLGFNLNL